MKNPNEKLQSALKKFFEVKVEEIEKKYHLDQLFRYNLCSESQRGDVLLCIDEQGVFLSDSSYGSIRENAMRYNHFFTVHADSTKGYKAWEWHEGFYRKYKDIVKALGKIQKEQDDLYRAVARFENRDKPAEQFSL